MKILIVKDGTVPVVVARCYSVDGDDEELEERTSDGDLALGFSEVDDGAEALWCSWADGMGLDAVGCTMAEGLRMLQGIFTDAEDAGSEDAAYVVSAISEVEVGHLVVTFNPGENEWYGHLIDIRGLA